MDLTQEQQDVAGQVGQSAIALFILAPTPINFPTVERNPLVEPCSVGVIFWQSIPLLFISDTLLLEFINLLAGACLSAIKTAGVEEDGPTHLLVVFINSSSREKRVDAPVCP